MFESPETILKWLCEKSGRPRIYADLRAPHIFNHQDGKPFKACIELARLLRANSAIVRQLLHHVNWRYQMIGNVVIVLNMDHQYEWDYVEKLQSRRVQFPAPLAAGWLANHTEKTIPLMQSYLSEMSEQSDLSNDHIPYSTVIAVHTALQILQHKYVSEFENSELFALLQSYSAYDHIVKATEKNHSAYMSFKLAH